MDWRIIPAPNPDGVLARPATRENAKGALVDRGFPANGGAGLGTAQENRWVIRQIADYRPDVIVSLGEPAPAQENTVVSGGNLNEAGVRTGSFSQYAALAFNAPVLRVHPGSSASMPAELSVRAAWERLIDGLHTLLKLQ